VGRPLGLGERLPVAGGRRVSSGEFVDAACADHAVSELLEVVRRTTKDTEVMLSLEDDAVFLDTYIDLIAFSDAEGFAHLGGYDNPAKIVDFAAHPCALHEKDLARFTVGYFETSAIIPPGYSRSNAENSSNEIRT
jgi:hypothetical protein